MAIDFVKHFKNYFLLVSVFMTGGAILAVEITALRILSPYYGNTIYAASAVIGIVLAALSAGYYFGGKMADKYPDFRLFYGIIFISGLLVILIRVLSALLLLPLGGAFSVKTGSFVFSFILFFAPSLCLGTLSPFAVKLYSQDKENVGSRSGTVFFWSTLGSIAGSFLSGFFFIPNFGVSNIIGAIGIFLCLWGIIGFLILRPPKTATFLFLAAIVLAYGIFLLWFYHPQKQPGVIYEKDGVYEKIRIVDGIQGGRPTRFLLQDRSHSAAMFLDSNNLVFDYTKYYKLYELFRPEAKKAFFVGGGAYSIPKAILSDLPEVEVKVAEIEPSLFELAKRYFNLKEDSRLKNYTEDGRRLLSQSREKYDIIVSDVYYSTFSVPAHFTSKEFFDLAKSRIEENGVFVGNFIGTLYGEGADFILSEIKTFREPFPNSYFFAVESPERRGGQNIIFLGINGNKKIDLNGKDVLENKNPTIKNLAIHNIDLNNFDFSRHKILTDDYAPVEYLVGKIISDYR